MPSIAFCLAGVFGLGFFADLASTIGASDTLAFMSSIMHAIAAYGMPAVVFVCLGHGAEA